MRCSTTVNKHNLLLLRAANEAGLEFNDYMEQQSSDSVCDGICTHCQHIEPDYLENDARNVDCPICGTPNMLASVMMFMEAF